MSNGNPRVDRDWLDKIRRRERFADFAFTLARVDWSFFTTHTFINPLPRQETRKGMFWRWCRDVGNFSEVPYKNLLIALRCEQGEIGERPHFHALVGGLTSCNMMSTRSRMFRQWKIIANNGAGDFRLYDRTLAGADYVCKCLGANAYEVNKFSLAEETTLSDSVLSLIRVMDAKVERRCDEFTRKDRQVSRLAGFKTLSQGLPGAVACPGSVASVLPVGGRIQDTTASPVAGMV